MNKFQKIQKAVNDGKTILGVGPMSWNCVQAVLEVANEQKIPIQLIASRRQVECKSLGGGYVTDTETLAQVVKSQDTGKYVYLARDHGGPWQGVDEQDLTHEQAMKTAKQSYAADILAGFDILHIDPSLKSRSIREIIYDIEELHEFCEERAENQIIYECGTEEHSGQISNIEDFNNFVANVQGLNNMQFVVGNMGYWVKELENVGEFDEQQAKAFVKICNENNLYLKGHNSDYLNSEQLKQYNTLGVHSINIAPQFGTRETEILLAQLEFHRLDKFRDKFIKLAVESGKWKKWMKDSDKEVPDLYKAKICGHYIFNTPEVNEIKKKLRKKDYEDSEFI